MSREIATFSMILGALLLEHARQCGLTQAQMQERAQVAPATWARVMKGEAHFQLEDVRSLASAVGVKLATLIADAEERAESLESREGIHVAGKNELKNPDDGLGKLIAIGGLIYLLSRLS